jgi:poly(3-hydroxybutyrate) depolymerase
MKTLSLGLLASTLAASRLFAATAANPPSFVPDNSAPGFHTESPAPRQPGDYTLTPDSLPHDGVPKGRLEGPIEFRSQIYSGTVRRYWIYVPDQYSADKPACLLVFQDGQRAIAGDLHIPTVLENLIAKKDIPVTVGLFITPGNTGDTYAPATGTGNPNHRAPEYDAVNDTYSTFLLTEMLPELAKKYRVTDDPKGRVIGGTSSGAICAFTVAYNHPDQFGNVISMIGSFESIGYQPPQNGQPAVSGGEFYPFWIRKNPPKPLRIFMQDGSNDLSNEYGDWFLGSQQMVSSMVYANFKARPGAPRFDLNYVWGDGMHSDKHGGSMLPEILRWIFRDYPK